MSELVPAGRRTLYQRGPLRRALLDTSVLTSDVIAATTRREPSSFVAGARAGTVRCLIPVHVWDEVPRVLADRHRESGGRFDLERALELWQSHTHESGGYPKSVNLVTSGTKCAQFSPTRWATAQRTSASSQTRAPQRTVRAVRTRSHFEHAEPAGVQRVPGTGVVDVGR
ncbi:hypothetical protein [Streptomyces beigongshangae]|uniref:hypothetical protein n=1 Tax=Streptomyces beigongshangae TaxID=2841597 RepID=UPI001C857A00|nr:hypothetical protein [Streptomyces sp. REN17]